MSTPAVAQMTRRQKAAALLLAIGPDASANLFPHLGEEEVEGLTREISGLGQLVPEDLAAIIDEVHADVRERRRTLVGDRDAAARFLRAWRGNRAETTISRLLGADDGRPFGFLRAYPTEQLADVLHEEHLQTVALVVANLPTERAAELLRTFDDTRRHEVALRVATLAPVQRSVIARVEEGLHRALGEPRKAEEAATAGGERDLATLLNQLPRDGADAIMAAIEARDPELAVRVREAMFVFDDLDKLDGRAVQEVLRGVDAATLATALKGASEPIAQLVWSNLSERAATAVREELELLGRLKRSDVENAQNEVVKTVRRLADEGAITLELGGDEETL